MVKLISSTNTPFLFIFIEISPTPRLFRPPPPTPAAAYLILPNVPTSRLGPSVYLGPKNMIKQQNRSNKQK